MSNPRFGARPPPAGGNRCPSTPGRWAPFFFMAASLVAFSPGRDRQAPRDRRRCNRATPSRARGRAQHRSPPTRRSTAASPSTWSCRPIRVLTPGANASSSSSAPLPTASIRPPRRAATGAPAMQGGPSPSNRDGSIDVIKTLDQFGYALLGLLRCPTSPPSTRTPPAPPYADSARPTSACSTSGRAASDTGFSQPHFFSQAFQVHPDPTDSGTLNPGDGSPEPATPVSSTLSTVTPASQTRHRRRRRPRQRDGDPRRPELGRRSGQDGVSGGRPAPPPWCRQRPDRT